MGNGVPQRVSISSSGPSAVLVSAPGWEIRSDKVGFQGAGGDANFILTVPGKLHRRYYGRLRLTSQGGELLPVVEMELETAVASVVAAESPPDAPLEALKAQAVVSRSYLVAGGPRHANADFCDTTHCQFLRTPPALDTPAARATQETRGSVLAWRAKPFAAMYTASCSGRTRSLAEVGMTARDYPYFPVVCERCRRSPQRWSSHLSEPAAADLKTGNEAQRIKTGRSLGWNAVPSNTFTVQHGPKAAELTGSGRGHGVGLCQRGAAGMAREGQDFRAILAHYFPNTTIELVPTH